MNAGLTQGLDQVLSGDITLIVVLLIWSAFWKGLALWHAAQRGDAWWFVALLVFNTIGLLEMLYLFVFAKIAARDLFSSRRA